MGVVRADGNVVPQKGSELALETVHLGASTTYEAGDAGHDHLDGQDQLVTQRNAGDLVQQRHAAPIVLTWRAAKALCSHHRMSLRFSDKSRI